MAEISDCKIFVMYYSRDKGPYREQIYKELTHWRAYGYLRCQVTINSEGIPHSVNFTS